MGRRHKQADQPSYGKKVFDPNSTLSADDLLKLIDSHYKNVSVHFGYETLPPESFINSLGYGLMGDSDKLDKAAALFNLNI
ncbi:MAG: hypothetical protein WBM42_12075 [Eudoraea sp.]|uniref:hypothetical protein n=1 Tax=Eudoraea sp. TaxID=1979955 RepID=UPI003C76E5AA